MAIERLDQKTLNSVLDVDNLLVGLRRLVGGNGGSNDGSGDTASSTDHGARPKRRERSCPHREGEGGETDLNRRGISSHDNEDECPGSGSWWPGPRLKLAQMGGLLDNVEDLLGEVRARGERASGADIIIVVFGFIEGCSLR